MLRCYGTVRSPEVRMNRLASYAILATLLIGRPLPALAQAPAPDFPGPAGYDQAQASDPPAHISIVDGTVSLERDGRPDVAPESMPLVAGDRLRTENGRVEVMFGEGATLHLDTSSTV